MKKLLAAAPIVLAAPTWAGDVSLFVGEPGAVGDVQVLAEEGSGIATQPPGLAGIELLPIEVAGRSRLTEHLPDRARRAEVAAGAARLVLPDGRGSLYRFRRSEGADGATHGFFAVGSDGAARVVFEHPGTGPAADEDPFVDRVAVAPDGASFLVATLPSAGGDLFEVDVAGGASNRTSDLPALQLAGAGLRLFASWGTAAGSFGSVRFARSPGAQAELVEFPGHPTWFGGEVVGSPSGTHAATVAGVSPSEAFVFAFAALGSAVQATVDPAPISPAGFLPEHLDGPFLAVADGGGTIAWRTEGASREAWIAPVAENAFHVTSNALFLETMDQAGVMRFQGAGGLLLAVGEPAVPGHQGIEAMDLYLVAPPEGAGPPSIANLTQSNGLAQPPFLVQSEIDPEFGLHALPGSDWILLHDSQSSSGELIAVDTATGTVKTLLDETKSLDLVEVAAGHVLVSVRRTIGEKRRELVSLDVATLTPTIIGSVPDESSFTRPAVRPDGRAGLVLELGAAEWLARVDIAAATGELLLPTPLSFGSTTAYSPAGALLFGVGAAGFPGWVVAWPDAEAPQLLLPTPLDGFVLPGA